MSAPPQVVRVQVILNPEDDPRQQYMNTWHCVAISAATPLDAATAFTFDLNTFYQAIDTHLSGLVLGSLPLARCFDLSEPMPRQPILEYTMGGLSNSGSAAAPEIACCVSYKGTYVSGVSPKRKRGRIYIGPLKGTCVDTSSGKLDGTMTASIANAADALITSSKADADYRWVVYSPASDPNAHDQGGGAGNDPDCWDAVVSGWVDDEPDIQRRRSTRTVGAKATFS